MTPPPDGSVDPITCFDRERLAAFLSGNLPAGQVEALTRHLESCALCTAQLADLALAARPFFAAAANLDPAFLAAPELQRMMEKAKQAPFFSPRPERLVREPTIPGYADLEPLSGRSGGRMYQARHEDSGQEVLIRFVPATAIAGLALIGRCMKSANAAATATQGHVLPMTGVIPAGDSLAIVTPFVDATSLDRIINHRRQIHSESAERTARLDNLPSAFAWLDQLLAHVQAIHQAGHCYPELRPSCILIDADDVVWLTDFMLARLLSPHNPILTVEHIPVHDLAGGAYMEPTFRIGHPAYVAPEEWSASRRPDARGDVFRLGVAAYQALTLRLPFQSIADEKHHRTATKATLAKADVPPPLQDVLLHALAPKPENRYASAADMAAEWRTARPGG
jgi:serine/threonine-protein kinase